MSTGGESTDSNRGRKCGRRLRPGFLFARLNRGPARDVVTHGLLYTRAASLDTWRVASTGTAMLHGECE